MRASGFSEKSKRLLWCMAIAGALMLFIVLACLDDSETPVAEREIQQAVVKPALMEVLTPPTETPQEAERAPKTEQEGKGVKELWLEAKAVPKLATERDIELIARTIWGEAGGIPNADERAAVAWCILNRVDSDHPWFADADTIEEVVTAPYQFHGYLDESWGECPQEHIDLAADVVERWEREHAGFSDVGRVLPKEFLWFAGNGDWTHNNYRDAYEGSYTYWDWSLPSPYTEA